ncbi:hypothetical protein PtA15_7A512 [Puccinia triticina]|uniref:Uncharacterized protein n=1 Tax=Puccinia triticina TaxID=208348 RepID=A0ABY7CNG8_9BASI|nr:uncharacterized protein PtA15_7A512 [Puccinia triticina]WAQ86783.1 hypothetical protein PtA15_7A512 [Puccinia triticina]WAR56650.1 hypothetical protein PtB15_7B500 [Puccinia triticina]
MASEPQHNTPLPPHSHALPAAVDHRTGRAGIGRNPRRSCEPGGVPRSLSSKSEGHCHPKTSQDRLGSPPLLLQPLPLDLTLLAII